MFYDQLSEIPINTSPNYVKQSLCFEQFIERKPQTRMSDLVIRYINDLLKRIAACEGFINY